MNGDMELKRNLVDRKSQKMEDMGHEDRLQKRRHERYCKCWF